ncbi:hypothetical protein CPG37_07050 [Malaciobacter canalis]|uniref:Transcriptional regulator n=1 Tax=Malaciobacter canalis TaxID=1912871 RepID=A0ABX4LQE0_9BACT|nr:hypothetical protein CPG37_07050 [Malaciobacter canalis]QEE33384.1 hypothetical protein ACAN_1920 [Malaciobacter canalis]
MWCPKCCGKTKVVGVTTGLRNERFRKCLDCGHSFQTLEAIRFDDYWKEYAKETFNEDIKIKEEKEHPSSNR